MATPAWLQKYERPAPMDVGTPIGRPSPSHYTGDGPADEVAEVGLVEKHKGEFVVSKPDALVDCNGDRLDYPFHRFPLIYCKKISNYYQKADYESYCF